MQASDQSITLPTNSISLSGTGKDSDGTVSYNWTKISGPSSGAITDASSAATSVTGLTEGTYQFELRVTDNKGATAVDTVQVIVNAAANIPPTSDAGLDQSITLPTNSISLSGTGKDSDGTVSYNWTMISGPTSGTITDASSAATSVTGLTEGTYQFELRVTDNKGATAVDTVQVIVNAAANIPPTADAGSDQVITLPTNTISLTGNGTDDDGTVTYNWTMISGPSSGTIADASLAATSVTGLTEGTYQFELRVTDNKGATAVDTLQVIVNAAANIPPTADAGMDQSITWPIDNVSLSGSGTDSDGTISSYNWTMISGPSAGTITDASSPGTSVTGLIRGIYQFELKVTDNDGATAVNTVQIIVNNAPRANAGDDQIIGLSIGTVSLAGSATDQDGTIVNYNWTQVSGPSTGKIVNPSSPRTDVSGLVQGIYQFELKVTDNNGATGVDDVQITVATGGNTVPVVAMRINELNINKNVVYQNFPNPFTNITTIRYDVADKAPVKIIVTNAVGFQVAVLANEIKQPGSYQIKWDAGNIPAGSYYYTIMIGDHVTTKKMLKIN